MSTPTTFTILFQSLIKFALLYKWRILVPLDIQGLEDPVIEVNNEVTGEIEVGF